MKHFCITKKRIRIFKHQILEDLFNKKCRRFQKYGLGLTRFGFN